eukprot:1234026-Pleurochrysis_carterae.AAC.3
MRPHVYGHLRGATAWARVRAHARASRARADTRAARGRQQARLHPFRSFRSSMVACISDAPLKLANGMSQSVIAAKDKSAWSNLTWVACIEMKGKYVKFAWSVAPRTQEQSRQMLLTCCSECKKSIVRVAFVKLAPMKSAREITAPAHAVKHLHEGVRARSRK